MASSNLATYLGSGLAADLPDAATLAANLFDGMTAFYFATDTNELYMLDPSGTPSWTVQSAPGGLYQPLSAVLTAYASGDTPSAFTLGIVDSVDAAAWRTAIGAGTSSTTGTVTSVDGGSSASGFSLTGGPVTSSGTLTFGVSDQSLARTSLGLGTMATESASNYLPLTGGTLTGNLGIVPANGVSAQYDVTSNNGSGEKVALATLQANVLGFASAIVQSYRTSTSTHCNFVGQAAYGTATAPAQIGAANVSLFELSSRPLASDLVTFAQQARLSFSSTSAHSSTNLGVYASIDLTANGSTTRTNSVTFYAGTGTSTIADVFEAAGNIKPSSDNVFSCGIASRRWSVIYAGTGTINTSDERQKRDIQPIRDDLLDAWANVNWVAYRFNEAYERKGEDARWHFGAIAQQVKDAIDAKLGEDAALRLGLVCYDEWDEQPEETVPVFATRAKPSRRPVLKERFIPNGDGSFSREVYDTGEVEDYTEQEEYDTGEVEIVRPYRAAGNRWGLRYTECFALEAAYQRRRMDRIEAALTSLGM